MENPAFDAESNGINVATNENTQDDKSYKSSGKSKGKFERWRESKRNKRIMRYVGLTILNLAVWAYFFVALVYWYRHNIEKGWHFCSGFGMLLVLYSLVYLGVIYYTIKRFFGKAIKVLLFDPLSVFFAIKFVKIATIALVIAAVILFLVFDTMDSPERLISLIGLVFFLVFGYVFSRSRSKIVWKPVVMGVALQFFMGLVTIRWRIGREIFQCIGNKVEIFLKYSQEGSSFVFGDFLVNELGVFAFQVLPVIFFFSLIIEVLFYWGVMQTVCLKMGWFLQVCMGTTVCESVISAANTFLGMSESPLLIRPYIPQLTKSELHAIMSSGFATVSGTVLAAYISFGAEPAHLITASVMSAPAALCYAKLFYPEDEESKTAVSNIEIMKSEESSVLDAASKGASAGIALVLNIAANLIGFVSLVAFLDSLLNWLGILVGWEFLDMKWIMGKIFTPLSWIMGVSWDECEIVGELIGIKTIINEFVAYKKMGEYKKANMLTERNEAIATYALCGFTNPSSIGIMVGALSAMAPTRRADIASVAFRGFVAGCAVCFMTASVAGILLSPGAYGNLGNSTTATPDYY